MSFPSHPDPRHIGMFESVGIDYIKISYPVSFHRILQKVETFVFASFSMSNSKEPSVWVLVQDICDEQINQILDTSPLDFCKGNVGLTSNHIQWKPSLLYYILRRLVIRVKYPNNFSHRRFFAVIWHRD